MPDRLQLTIASDGHVILVAPSRKPAYGRFGPLGYTGPRVGRQTSKYRGSSKACGGTLAHARSSATNCRYSSSVSGRLR